MRPRASRSVMLPHCVGPGRLVGYGPLSTRGNRHRHKPSFINQDRTVFGADTAVSRPEQWLEDPERVAQTHLFVSSWGFGMGKRAGENLALLETYRLCLQGKFLGFYENRE